MTKKAKILIQNHLYEWLTFPNRLAKEGNESVTKYNRLKLEAADGKKYLTDVADAETVSYLPMEKDKCSLSHCTSRLRGGEILMM